MVADRAQDDSPLEERIAHLEAKLDDDRWAGRVIWRGGYPRIPVVDALPVASAQYAYAKLVLRGTPDIEYTCLRDAAAAWAWEVAATG